MLPTLAVGDIARVVVRQGQQDGLGLILLKGQLIKASLPPTVKPGDTLVAQVTDTTDQILLKILNVLEEGSTGETGHTTAGGKTPTAVASERLAEQLKLASYSPGSSGLRPPAPFSLPISVAELESQLQLSKTQLAELSKALGSASDLTDANQAFDKLLAATDGATSAALRSVAKLINAFVERNTPPPADRLIQLIRGELDNLYRSADDNFSASKSLDLLTSLIEKETKEAKKGPEKEALRQTLQELTRSDSAPVKTKIETALAKLEHSSTLEQLAAKVAPRMLDELKQIAVRLDQMAATQELLNQLNPVMQALGEPALILLPFLFQGLFSHTEVTIDSHLPDKKKDDGTDTDGKKGKKSSETYHRIQVNVPLPSIGPVGVDIAYKQKEIMVRMTVENQDVGSFLLEQLEHLAVILKEQGFEKAELVAHVGVKRENLPSWTLGLHAATSLFA